MAEHYSRDFLTVKLQEMALPGISWQLEHSCSIPAQHTINRYFEQKNNRMLQQLHFILNYAYKSVNSWF